ncbi:unannotated protein [freshwater metagenome]|uniref:Unannotated protein n=1 Tax=freshwater metagenome TaxID=449393 RepID=A0A6J6QP95_9ZZZZ
MVIEHASSDVSPAGAFIKNCSGVMAYSPATLQSVALTLLKGMEVTRSPIANLVTPLPIASTMPHPSRPIREGRLATE